MAGRYGAGDLALRSAVIGRRLSFGSDSEKGAEFTAMMYSVAGTLAMSGINVRRGLDVWLRPLRRDWKRTVNR